MEKISDFVATPFIGAAPSFAAQGVEIVNEDDTDYLLSIVGFKQMLDININPEGRLRCDCGDCFISIYGDAIEATGNEVISIRDGQLSKSH